MSTETPTFPPLFYGQALSGANDPFARAQTQALMGCDAGLVAYNLEGGQLRAAMVFAPEVSLTQAMPVMVACGIGFQNALGALAPPEVGVHLTWDGGIEVNGARCGGLRVAASGNAAGEIPDWIVIGLSLPLIPQDQQDQQDPGREPDQTCLFEEGCVDVSPVTLLEAWVRHSLVWINRMTDEGNRALHEEWRGLCGALGEDVTLKLGNRDYSGTFVGVDENFGMLLRTGDDTTNVPLTALLDEEDR